MKAEYSVRVPAERIALQDSSSQRKSTGMFLRLIIWSPGRYRLRRVVLLGLAFDLAGCSNRVELDDIASGFKSGNPAAARQLAERFVQERSRDRDSLLGLAQLAEAARDSSTASAALSSLVEQDPRDVELRRRLAFALLDSNQYEQAELAFRETLRLRPTDEAAQTELQWILFHQLRERELEGFLEGCLTQEPTSHRLLYHLLVSSQKRPNPHESMPILERIDQTHPGQQTIVFALACCAWKVGEIERARNLFDRAAGGEPLDLEERMVLAEFELEQWNDSQVESALTPSGAVTQANLEASDRYWWLRSQLAARRGDLPAALQAVSEASRLYPRSLTYLHFRVDVHRILGQRELADQLLAEVEARRAADARLHLIVESGELERATPALLTELSALCAVQQKAQQAAGWEWLAKHARQ